MSNEFSRPPGKGNPKIAETVPLSKADPAKQEEYAKFNEVLKEQAKEDLSKPLPETPAESTAAPPEPVASSAPPITIELGAYRLIFQDGLLTAVDKVEEPPPPPDPAEPNEDEKRVFVRSILGSKSYEREFVLFGDLKVLFRDRDVPATEAMYAAVEAHLKDKNVSEEEWGVCVERYMCATTFVKTSQETVNLGPGNINDHFDALCKLPRPIYTALMDASRTFERHIEMLVGRAQDRDFWKAGGAGSQ